MNRPYILPRVISLVVIVGVLAFQAFQGLQSDPPFSGPGDARGLLIAAGVSSVMLIVVWRAFRPASVRSSAFRDAQLGIGTLVSARPTGTSINDQPELELVLDVETAEGTTFRSSAKEIIDMGTLAQLVPGATVAVRYLPGGRIGVDPSATEEQMTDVLAAARLAQGRLTTQQLHVARNGVRASAVMMQCRPTGEIVDGEAVIHLDFRVTRADGTAFDSSRELPLPPVALPGLQPGNVVEARYLPGDEGYVALEIRMR